MPASAEYLVQHDFESEEEKERYADVSFWTNLGISALMTALIIPFGFRSFISGAQRLRQCDGNRQRTIDDHVRLSIQNGAFQERV